MSNSNLNFCHFNAQSLTNKFHEVKNFINSNNYKIITISETWLNASHNDEMFSITGYHLLRSDRVGRGGGVAVYISTDIKFEIIDFNNTYQIEMLVVKLCFPTIVLIVVVLYKPPNVNYLNLTVVHDLFEHLYLNGHYNAILLGDLNINMIKTSPASTFLKNIIYEHSCIQLIDSPTRVCSESESLLDLIIVSESLNISNSGVLDHSIADHNTVFCSVDINCDVVNVTKTFRSFSNFNRENFLLDLSDIDWHCMYNMTDINEKVSFFNDQLTAIFDIHAPLKTKTFGSKRTSEPWFTDTLRSMKKLKTKAWSKFKSSRSPIDRKYFCDMRNIYNAALLNEKKAFLNFHINANFRNSKNLWSTLKSNGIVKSNPISSSLPEQLCDATLINDYFIDSIPREEIPENYAMQFGNNKFSDISFEFQYASVELVRTLILKQKPHTVGYEGISGKMLQHSLPNIAEPLTHIINFSFESGTFPLIWKQVLVKPIPKNNKIKNISELRPISLLSVPSKIAEGVIHQQLTPYMFNSDVIPKIQSGFQKNHGTSTTLLSILDDVLSSINSDKVTSLTLLDMSKAFDSLNTELLLKKLKYYGINDNILMWFTSYLLNRYQYICLDTSSGRTISSKRLLLSGVPQGSILGPLLFNVYTADLPQVIKYSSMHMYADDVQLYLSFDILATEEAQAKINYDLNRIRNWTLQNSLILNPKKSKNIVLGTPNRLRALANFQLFIDNIAIEQLEEVKNLGLTIDKHLNFIPHISEVCRKCFCSFKQISGFRNILGKDVKLLLCESLVISHVNYCDYVYGPCLNLSEKNKLQKIQNICIRFVTNTSFYEHVTPHIRQLELLKLNERRFVHFSSLLNNVIILQQPTYLFDKLLMRNTMHNRNLRYTNDHLCTTRPKYEKFRSSFTYLSTYVYNNLPLHLHDKSTKTLKNQLKALVLSENLNINFNLF